ncbi:unnamed protein product [Lactuca virosa]|uniref:Uncharacterized protein n=1 Tax=Lactuca virosa TaxID=75947 RepID=A0AAU9NDB5_9ASTR|nr:unnamed protein product [Lactuca virosa]
MENHTHRRPFIYHVHNELTTTFIAISTIASTGDNNSSQKSVVGMAVHKAGDLAIWSDDRINRVGESSGKSTDGLKGSDGRRDEIEVRSCKTKKGRKRGDKLGKVSKRGKNATPVCLIVESDDDVDDHVGLNEPSPPNHCEFRTEDTFGSGKVEKKLRSWRSSKKARTRIEIASSEEILDNKSARTNDSQHNSDDDDVLSLLEGNVKSSRSHRRNDSSGKTIHEDKFVTSHGCLLDESDDHEHITLDDDITCLDDTHPSHSSRVRSNDVKLSPVELDSI